MMVLEGEERVARRQQNAQMQPCYGTKQSKMASSMQQEEEAAAADPSCPSLPSPSLTQQRMASDLLVDRLAAAASMLPAVQTLHRARLLENAEVHRLSSSCEHNF